MNAVGACAVAVNAIAMDALSALPPTVVKDVPSSLRCTAMVLVFCLGSPVVMPDAIDVDLSWQQRGLAFIGLIFVAAMGDHASEVNVRVADAVFVLISGWAGIFLFVHKSQRAVSGSALFGAFLTYVGSRAARVGLVHSAETRAFSVSGDSFETQGYALADTTIAVTVVFAGSILTSTGIIILLNTDLINAVGSHAVSPIVSMNSGCAFAAALVSQLSVYSRIGTLPSLFGASACTGGPSVCAAAYRARRFYLANSSSACLWAGIVASTIFSLPKSRRCLTRRNFYLDSRLGTASGTIAALVSAVAIVASFVFASGSSMVIVQVEIILLYIAIPTAWFVSTPGACILSIAGNVMYMGQHMNSSLGFNWSYFTHWSLFATLCLTTVLCVTTGISRGLYLFQLNPSPVVETITGVVVAAATSIQLALTLATLGLVVSYDGSYVANTSASWSEQGFQYTAQHSLGFFFFAAVLGSRYEMGDPVIANDSSAIPISLSLRRISWLATPPILGLGWIIRLVASKEQSPYDEITGMGAFYVAVVSAFVSWIVVGLGI